MLTEPFFSVYLSELKRSSSGARSMLGVLYRACLEPYVSKRIECYSLLSVSLLQLIVNTALVLSLYAVIFISTNLDSLTECPRVPFADYRNRGLLAFLT